MLADHRERLREQRDALVDGLRRPAARLARSGCRPAGWRCGAELPGPPATALAAEAERHGVIVAPGPVFAAEGGLDRFVRIPWTRPADELEPRRVGAGSPRPWDDGRRPTGRLRAGRARPAG